MHTCNSIQTSVLSIAASTNQRTLIAITYCYTTTILTPPPYPLLPLATSHYKSSASEQFNAIIHSHNKFRLRYTVMITPSVPQPPPPRPSKWSAPTDIWSPHMPRPDHVYNTTRITRVLHGQHTPLHMQRFSIYNGVHWYVFTSSTTAWCWYCASTYSCLRDSRSLWL